MNPEANQNSGGKSLRLIRPSIVILCGPSACGKSTFAKTHFRPTQIVSSDYARALVCDDERDQRFNAQAFALVHYLVEARLTLNRLCVVDSTALTAQARKDLINLAKKCQVQTTLIIFTAPLETCIERDAKREKPVGQAVIERQYQMFEASKDFLREEGFDQVFEFNGDEQERVRIDILFRPVQRPQRVDALPQSKFERPGQRVVRRPSGYGPRISGFPVSFTAPSNATSVESRVEPSNGEPVASQVAATKSLIVPAPAAGEAVVTSAQSSLAPTSAGKKNASSGSS